MIYKSIIGVLLIIILSGGWYMTKDRLNTANDKIENLNIVLDQIKEDLRKEKEERIKAQNARDNYYDELEIRQHEIIALRNGLDSAAYGLRIGANCPERLSEAERGAERITEDTCTLNPQAERAYITLLQGIAEWEEWGEYCVRELKIRANVD